MENLKSIIKEEVNEISKEEKRERELNHAAYKLSDEIWPIYDKLEKARLLIEELTDEYFLKYDPEVERDRLIINFEFHRNAILMGMVADYVFKAFREVKVLDDRKDLGMEAKNLNVILIA